MRLRSLALLTALVTALASTASVGARAAGTVSGTFTVNGKATPITHVYATSAPGFFDKTKMDTVVVLTDVAVTAAQVEDHFALGDLAKAGKLHGIQITIQGDKQIISCSLFDAAFKMSASAAGSNNVFEGTIAPTHVKGKAYTVKGDDFNGTKFAFSITFDTDVVKGK